ncbi:hypothetical protein HY631_01800, partial [Candidatus Uhrbacteria bacterium]|nr:hypothetical protein [Candidatus Uhrbacteria bacterium]
AEMVGKICGPEAEAAMRSLGDKPPRSTPEAPRLILTPEERALAEAAERALHEKKDQRRRREYIAWASDLGFDEGWVDDTFIFHSNGSVETEGNLDFRNKPSVRLPDSLVRVGGHLFLDGLTSAQGLTLPEKIGRSLYLNGLTSAEGLTLPEKIDGWLSLNGLTSAQGLTLPREIRGNLFLDGLTSAEGLTLPEKVGLLVWMKGLSETDIKKIKEERSDLSFHFSF